MAVEKNARDLRSLQVLLHERAWAKLEAALDGPDRARLEAEGIQHFCRTQQLSESDRLLVTLGYGLWRGFGPSIDVHALWGMDPAIASRVLAGLAAAIDPDGATGILRQSIELLEGTEPSATEPTLLPKLVASD
jgi:hypothetical protein